MGEIQPLDYSMLLNAGRTFNPMQVYLQSQQVKGIQSENRLRDLQSQAAAQEMPLNLENKKLEYDTKKLQLDEGKKKLSREEAVQTLSTIGAASKQLLDEYSSLLGQPGMTEEQARNQIQPRYTARIGQLRESGLLTGKVQDVFDPSYLLSAYTQSGAALQRMKLEREQANINKTTMETAEIAGKPGEAEKERANKIDIAKLKQKRPVRRTTFEGPDGQQYYEDSGERVPITDVVVKKNDAFLKTPQGAKAAGLQQQPNIVAPITQADIDFTISRAKQRGMSEEEIDKALKLIKVR